MFIGQYREAASDITKAVHFLQSEYALDSLNTHNIRTILEYLKTQVRKENNMYLIIKYQS